MSLKTYHGKRHFGRTSEPRGAAGVEKRAKAGGGLSFVIQKHAASHLHFDFRLELDGVLRSWAVPKGPSLDPADKRLAVEVEDHPIEYGGFEGTIPAGEYGGGTVMLWDRGTWTPWAGSDPRTTLAAGKLHFELRGERLRGAWSLVRIRAREAASKPQWLLRKSNVKGEQKSSPEAMISGDDRSVSTGRTMEEIAAGKGAGRVWSSGKSRASGAKTTAGKAGGQKASAGVARGKKKGAAGAGRGAARGVDAATIPGAVRAKMAREVEVQLATLATAAPIGEEWIHEIKFDGYRVVGFVEGETVRLDSRNGKSLTELFAPVGEALKLLGVESAIVDGECVAVDSQGRTSFQELRRVMKGGIADRSLACYLFDLLYLNGYDLRACMLKDRREALRAMIEGAGGGLPGIIQFSEAIVGQGEAVLDQACRLALEGIVSKRVDSTYTGGRGTTWIKSKCINRQELVIGGYTEARGTRQGFGALLTGVYDEGGKLVYTGKVGTGFDHAMLVEMIKRMRALEIEEPAFVSPPGRAEAASPHWIKPTLVCEVEFTEWTRDGRLRHPSFVGLRVDKVATEVVREKAVAVSRLQLRERSAGKGGADAGEGREEREGRVVRGEKKRSTKPLSGQTARAATTAPAKARTTKRSSVPVAMASVPRATRVARPTRRGGTGSGPANDDDKGGSTVLGIEITHPERVLFAGAKTTKLELARYVSSAAEWMMPEVLGRPLSVVRCPRGQRASKCFFQKNWEKGKTIGSHVRTIKLTDSTINALVVDSPEGLVWLVQNGVLEIHTWGCKETDIERPDRMVFDLDPSPELAWGRVVEAGVLVRDCLRELGLKSVVKTTGGKGLHVIVNLRPRAGWDEVKAFAKELAETIVGQFPDRYIAKISKAARTGKVFIDYLRNGRGATFIAAYSSRARDGGPVAMPMSWEELEKSTARPVFTVEDAMERIGEVDDPWEKMPRARELPLLGGRK